MEGTIPQLDSLDAAVRHWMGHWNVPGMTVGVLHKGEVQTFGYGTVSLETQQPVRPDTLFRIGSISKVFCATLAMTLVDEGKLNLDMPVIEYLPELKLGDERALEVLTMRQLLSHTGGFYGDEFSDHGMGDDALEKAIAAYGELRQYTQPGESWAYSNSGFDLAGRVVEKLLGQGYEAAMRERIFRPLDMERSFFFAHEAIAYSVAVGHTLADPNGKSHKIHRAYYIARRHGPCAAIISTVGDLLAFARFHLGDPSASSGQAPSTSHVLSNAEGSGQAQAGETRVLSPGALDAMRQQQTSAANVADAWGIGWDINYVDGVTVIGHGGSGDGFQALLKLVPEQRFAIAMLSNGTLGGPAEARIYEWALEHYCGLHVTRPATITIADEHLKRVAGAYTMGEASGHFTVAAGGLLLEFKAQMEEGSEPQLVFPPVSLKPLSNLEFLAIDSEFEGMRVDFIPGAGQSIRYVRFAGRLADRV